MKVLCLYDKITDIKDLVSHPLNRNKHPKEQIERLAKILEYQGWRYPVKVSKRSGYITSGHGRILAARINKWKQVPVNFQDYESEEQEYADVQADNAIALWAELSLDEIKMDLEGLPDLDIDLIGFKIDSINPTETDLPELSSSDPDIQQVTFTLSNEQKDILDEAMEKAKKNEDCSDEINKNKNGNILAAILKKYVS